MEAFAIVVVGAFSFVGAYPLLKLTNKFVSLRVSKADEEMGLDISLFGEASYEE